MLKNKNLIFAIILIISPIIFTYIAYPDTYTFSWNQGRGALLFGLIFIIVELMGVKLEVPKNKLLIMIPVAALTMSYFVLLDYGLRDYIVQVGEDIEVALPALMQEVKAHRL